LTGSGITLNRANNVTIEDSIICGFSGDGILLLDAINNTISENTITNNTYGIEFDYFSINTFIRNTFAGNTHNIHREVLYTYTVRVPVMRRVRRRVRVRRRWVRVPKTTAVLRTRRRWQLT